MSADSAAAGWAANTPHFQLGPPRGVSDVAALADRLEIEDLVYRYCWAIDHLKADVLASLFTKDVRFITSIAGQELALPVETEIADWIVDYMRKLGVQRRHFVTNLLVSRQSGDAAEAMAYLLIASGETPPTVVATGWYAMEVRKDDHWKIAFIYDGVDGRLPSDEWGTE
jgi:hypothetical protein